MMCRSPSSVSSACCRIKRLEEKIKGTEGQVEGGEENDPYMTTAAVNALQVSSLLCKNTRKKNTTREKTPTHTNTHCPPPSTPPTAEKRAME